MNSAAQVDQMVAQWKNEGLTKEQIIVRTAEAELGWPYVWGAVAAQCTPSKREYYANRDVCPEGESKLIRSRCQVLNGSKSVCDGCTFYPNNARVLIDDCQGFVKQLQSRVGITLSGGGATSMWNNNANWSQKGDIKDIPLGKVCCVFMKDGEKMSHVGEHVGQGNVIHCSGTVKRGKITDRGWTHYAIPKGLDGSAPDPSGDLPTLRRGSSGEYVTLMQTKLIQRGYDLNPYGADGKFGAKTESAVRKFQADNGLVVDGICGRNTWSALQSSQTTLYTVTISHVSKSVADEIVSKFGGTMKAE